MRERAFPLPLFGRTVLVTRPRAQSARLIEGIAALGGTSLAFPLLVILPLAEPLADSVPFQEAVRRLPRCALAIFISANAARFALPALRDVAPDLFLDGWPEQVKAIAVGIGTARALAEMGVTDCLVPDQRFDSEGLLALPECSAPAIRNKNVLIFQGEGGRDLIAQTLLERGARLLRVPTYRRAAPTEGKAEFLRAATEKKMDAITLTSAEALRHLIALPEKDEERAKLRSLPLFTPHSRVAKAAEEAEFSAVFHTPPGDEGLLSALADYFSRAP